MTTQIQTAKCGQSWCRCDHAMFGPGCYAIVGELPIADASGTFAVSVRLAENADVVHGARVTFESIIRDAGVQDLSLTPAVARSLAAALVRAADLLEI